jgi:hypothetical protein
MIVSRRFDGLTTSALVTKDLFLQRVIRSLREAFALTVLIPSLFDFIGEHPNQAFDCLPFSRTHLRLVELLLGCDLIYCFVTTQ